ncbi:MAG TPA: ABC transporter permease [Steroidobacteraceae bacterium]|nr:ABC transporter permease [Steroidobacteraceae bacterium]
MLEHYLRMALRGFVRHKLYSFINILGLTVALTCAILILLFVRDQLSYDDWIPGTSSLYRLEVTFHAPGQPPLALALCPFPVLTAVGKQIPQVTAVTHVVLEKMTVSAGDRSFAERVTVVDPDFFRVIRLPLLEGSAARVLAQPESIVLSQHAAQKYFGGVDPIGKTVRVSGVWDKCQPNDLACYRQSHVLTVTGVLHDLPGNTQLVADFVMPNTSQADLMSPVYKEGGWTNANGVSGYVALAPGADRSAVLRSVAALIDRSVDRKRFGLPVQASRFEQFDLTPFRNVHLTDGKLGDMTPPGNRGVVFGFALVAALIVVIASFNFMNLATARATLRAREIALRKLTGAGRRQLVAQFLGEAMLTAAVSLGLALSLVEVVLPLYDGFLGRPIALHYLSDWKLLGALAGGALAIGFLSGLYPALVLSGFRPVTALKAGGAGSSGSGALRSLLVVGQFAVSIGLAVATLVMFRQVQFAHGRDGGFDRRNMVVIRGLENLAPAERRGLQRVLNTGPGVVGAALSNVVPFNVDDVRTMAVQAQGSTGTIDAQWIEISPEFQDLYSMRLLAGRLLSSAHGRDVAADWADKNVLINLEMARRMGVTADGAIGQRFELPGMSLAMPMKVVGVVDNAMYYDPRSPARASVYLVNPTGYLTLSVKVRAGELPAAESYIDHTLRSFAPGVALTRYFLSDSFEGLFRADERQDAMFAVFAGIAVLIASLGLFGLVVFTGERSTKEIGIRKVSGARTHDILRLMLWRISVPVLLANLLAWPAAYVYLRHWLDGYAYRISPGPLDFLAAGAVALLIAWATVYVNTLRLARTSPVHALRYE